MIYYLALGVGVVVSLGFTISRASGNSFKNLIFKTIASLLFILTGVFAVIENEGAFKYGALIIMGGALSLVGDILLDLKGIYLNDADKYLFGGFSFFLTAHLFFSGAIIYFTEILWWQVLVCVVVSVVVAALVVASADLLKVQYGKFKGIVFSYSAILCITNATAICAAIISGEKYMILMAAGATLFTLSDAVLNNTYFGKDYDKGFWLFLNHFFYYAAQYLIASSIFLFGK